jgi:hypothetical protein
MSEQTITADNLCKLTGMTDRRHRQLAAQGFFPPPVKSMYLLSPTITGMFKYYRDLNNPELKKQTEMEKHRKLKIANDKSDNKLVDADKNDQLLIQVSKGIQAVLRQELCHGLPSNAANQDAPAIAILAENVYNKVIREVKKFLKTPELKAILDKSLDDSTA